LRTAATVRSDKAEHEHNESAYPPIADIRADIVDGSEVPIPDIGFYTAEGLRDGIKQRRNVEISCGGHPFFGPQYGAALRALEIPNQGAIERRPFFVWAAPPSGI
jgi:hypothetical protein